MESLGDFCSEGSFFLYVSEGDEGGGEVHGGIGVLILTVGGEEGLSLMVEQGEFLYKRVSEALENVSWSEAGYEVGRLRRLPCWLALEGG